MPQPAFPDIDPGLTRDKALNMILASIAMEKVGLSHIINVEGEKSQYILGHSRDPLIPRLRSIGFWRSTTA